MAGLLRGAKLADPRARRAATKAHASLRAWTPSKRPPRPDTLRIMTTARAPEISDADVLRETLDALEMPPHGLRRWFADDRAFCEGHGGRRVYGELLALLDECETELAKREGEGG